MPLIDNEARHLDEVAHGPESADPRRTRSAPTNRSAVTSFLPGAIVTLARIAGLLAMLEVALPGPTRQVHGAVAWLPAPASDAATAITVVFGLLLLRVAAGLRRRRRTAWLIAVGASAIVSVDALVRAVQHRDDALVLLLSASALLVLLWCSRSEFSAASGSTTRWFAPRLLAQFAITGMTLGMVTLWLNPENVPKDATFGTRLLQVAAALVGTTGPLQLSGTRFRALFTGTLLMIGLLTAAVVLVAALRPPTPRPRRPASDDRRARQLLTQHGRGDSLGYFALRGDKSLIWSASGKAAIAYRVVNGVLLASGDPIGDPDAWSGAMAAYRELAEGQGWVQAVLGCSELGATVYRRECGLQALAIGDEAIVRIDEFSTEGRAMRGVRQACARIERAGYEVQVRRSGDIGDAELADIIAAAADWRTDATERGFSMALSRLGRPEDADCVVVTAKQQGRLRGLLHFVPWGADGLSLDLMRRDRGADNGVNEFLIVALIGAAPQLGVRRLSLNFAVFREGLERGERIGAGPLTRAWRRLLILASRWWQIESLYRFNVKFRPDWQPRLLSYQAVRDLPRIVLAALRAEAFVNIGVRAAGCRTPSP